MNTPIYYRSRIALFDHLIETLPLDSDKKKNTPRELLKQGYWDDSLGDEQQKVIDFQKEKVIIDDSPLKLSELTRFSTWFVMHPEKLAGIEKVTTSLFFPVKIDGTKDDVTRIIRAGIAQINNNTSARRIGPDMMLKMRMKAKALKLKFSLMQNEPAPHEPAPLQEDRSYFVTKLNTDLQKEYDKFNNLVWNGQLKRVPLQWGMSKVHFGCVRSHGLRNNIRSYIVDYLEISLFNKINYQDFVDTLVHEMIHVYIITNYIKDTDSHGVEFRKEMKRINSMNLGINITVTGSTSGMEVSEEIKAKEYVVSLVWQSGIPLGITVYNRALYNDVPRWYQTKYGKYSDLKFKHVLSNDVNLMRFKANLNFSNRTFKVDQKLWESLESARSLSGKPKPELEIMRYVTIY